MSKKVEIIIDPLGNPSIEAIGFGGQGCTDATAAIEKALAGSGQITREYKPEWAAGGTNNQQSVKQSW